MTAVEKITESILCEAKQEAESIINAAKAEAEAILQKAKAESDALEVELKAEADKKAAATAESQKSASALHVRNAVLLKKREEIDNTLDELLKHFFSLETGEYFDVLLSLAKQRAKAEDGVMYLNSTDLKRMPKDFSKALESLKITVSTEALDTVSGGFVLKYGDVEENADFKALIAEKYELLTDIIGRELF